MPTARPEVVLERILTPATWPEWQSEILRVEGPERLSEGDVVLGDAQASRLRGRRPQHLAGGHSRLLLEDVIVGVRMRVRYTVSPDGNGTRVTHRLESDLPRGVAGRVLSVFLRWRLAQDAERRCWTIWSPSHAGPVPLWRARLPRCL